MEAWLSIPIRLIGVALLAWLAFLAFDGVRANLAKTLSDSAASEPDVEPAKSLDPKIPLLAIGVCVIAVLLVSIERKNIQRFQSVVAAINAFHGSIHFDPPATEANKQYNARLATVDLSDTNVTDDLFPDVERIPNLRVVRLANTAIGSGAISKMAACKKLERIDVSQTSLTSSDLRPLAEHPKLKSLIVNDTKINDDVVATLSTCASLIQIEARNTHLSENGIQTLAAALPMATISLASSST